MSNDHARLTRLVRQAIRRGDHAAAGQWMRAAERARPGAPKSPPHGARPADTLADDPDPNAARRQHVRAQLNLLIARMEREIEEDRAQREHREDRGNLEDASLPDEDAGPNSA